MTVFDKTRQIARRGWLEVRTTVSGAMEQVFPDACAQVRHAARQDGWRLDGPDDYCQRCGVTVPFESRTERGCAFCIDKPIRWDRITRLGGYVEPMDRWVRAMKFNRQWHWTDWFGQTLAEMAGDVGDKYQTAVTAVPMHWRRRWQRGYNQSQMIADRLARDLGLQTITLLRRVKHTQPQWSQPMSKREANVRGAFELAEDVDLNGWRILLVDDVKTTGATLDVCTRLLKKAGAKTVSAMVVAVANNHRDAPQRPGLRA